MQTALSPKSGIDLEQKLWSAKYSVSINSLLISSSYAEHLVEIARVGVEVRVITSNDGRNFESINILKKASGQNLTLLVTREEFDRETWQPKISRQNIYIVDGKLAATTSANLTLKDLYFDSNPITFIEKQEDIQRIEVEFLKLWSKIQRESSVGSEELELQFRNPMDNNVGGHRNCNVCGRAIGVSKSEKCSICGKRVCKTCITHKGPFNRAMICMFCKVNSAREFMLIR